jgi:hypothetical protein
MSKPVFIISAVNDDQLLAGNLLRSPDLMSGVATLIQERQHTSAGTAFNAGLKRSNEAHIVAFVHQDVYLPAGWLKRVEAEADRLEQRRESWGILGVFGRRAGGWNAGCVWSSGLGSEIGAAVASPAPVVSLDEVAIVMRRDAGLRFDENLPGFHLYGTDIVQAALAAGHSAYVIDAPLVHNSRPVERLDSAFGAAYRYLQRKWRGRLPIQTCTVPITRSGWPLLRHRLATRKRRLLQGPRLTRRHPDPAALAESLGYVAERNCLPTSASA